MSYYLLDYFAVFLPIVICIYQIVPKKIRFIVMLAADYVFFCMISGFLLIYLLAASFIAYGIGIWIEKKSVNPEKKSKEIKKDKRKVLAVGIIINLLVLLILKYFNFFGENINSLINIFAKNSVFTPVKFLVPIGISYYTLQIISYLTDVYRGTQKAEHNFMKIALYLSFFPQIMEGPISRFHEIADDLYSGNKITYKNLTFGYQRIVWGLFKKLVIADRIAPAVANIFRGYNSMDGSVVLFGAFCYTCQLYMEFSGCIDIVIGSGQIFGVTLPENFRQPFFAKNASEFWRRWHITLGTWFKDYIFYPVSLAKPVKNIAKWFKNHCGRTVQKFVAPTIALFCVWICNGLWHGARWTYIFYGMYYFVLIFIENIIENPVKNLTSKLGINMKSKGYIAFQMIKLFIIVNLGEMFFRANTVSDGFVMLKIILTNFHISEFVHAGGSIRVAKYDLIIAFLGVIVVLIVGILKERGHNIREDVAKMVLPARWTIWYAMIMFIVIFGAYGAGYTAVEMIYAGY